MKKLYLIIFLVLANVSLLYVRIFSNKLKKIELNLKEGEVAIIILSLEESKSFLLSSKNGNLLYTFSYKDNQNLEQNISLFTDHLDYVFMRNEYPLSYPNKTVLDGLVVIQNIQLEPNRLYYNNRVLCINEVENCDFVYLTEEISLSENIDVVFYDESLSDTYIETLHKKWIDTYKITNDSYTILLLNDDYEVIHLAH